MRMIFEDSTESALHMAIEKIYGDVVDDIIFVGGSGNLRKELKDDTIVYHDLVPDNPNTSKSYKMTRRLAHRMNNSVVIPMVCSEYAILKAFSSKQVPELNDIVLSKAYEGISGVKTSESYYKYLLRLEKNCIHDVSYGTSDIESLFYKTDCPCGKCDLRDSYKLSDKFDDLVCTLPLFLPFKSRNKIDMVNTKNFIRQIEIEHNRLVNIYAQLYYKNGVWVDKALINKLIV